MIFFGWSLILLGYNKAGHLIKKVSAKNPAPSGLNRTDKSFQLTKRIDFDQCQ
jgi:hypothetical protein